MFDDLFVDNTSEIISGKEDEMVESSSKPPEPK